MKGENHCSRNGQENKTITMFTAISFLLLVYSVMGDQCQVPDSQHFEKENSAFAVLIFLQYRVLLSILAEVYIRWYVGLLRVCIYNFFFFPFSHQIPQSMLYSMSGWIPCWAFGCSRLMADHFIPWFFSQRLLSMKGPIGTVYGGLRLFTTRDNKTKAPPAHVRW